MLVVPLHTFSKHLFHVKNHGTVQWTEQNIAKLKHTYIRPVKTNIFLFFSSYVELGACGGQKTTPNGQDTATYGS